MPRAGRRSGRRRQTGGRASKPRSAARTPETDPAPVPEASVVRATPEPPPVQTVRPQRGTPRPTAAAQSAGGAGRGRLYRWTHPRFAVEIVSELRKVVWPSRAETRSLTTVVIVIAVAVGVLLGSVDWVFNRLMENVLLN